MSALELYFGARKALAEAVRIDEAKAIRDKAAALEAYALQAKDSALIERATEIKLRAERRCGELLKELADRGERAGRGGGDRKSKNRERKPTLEAIGLSKHQSSRWQKLADLQSERFEIEVERRKQLASMSRKERRSLRASHEQPNPSGMTSFDSVRIRSGEAIGDVRWSSLERLIEENRREAVLLAAIASFARPHEPNAPVRDILRLEEFERMYADAQALGKRAHV